MLVSAKDCLVESAYQQMMLTKNTFGKTTGRQYVHFIQSFAPDDKLTLKVAHEIGQRMLAPLNYQGVVATHTNTGIIHNHIVLNSVSTHDGHKWQLSKDDLQTIKNISDELCLEYGLSVIQKGRGWKSYGEREAGKTGSSWKSNLAEVVGQCVRQSSTRAELAHKLHEYGIEVIFGWKQLLFQVPKWDKVCGSDKLLVYGDFTRENIAQYLRFNALQIENGFGNVTLLGKVCQDLGALIRPDDPDSFQQDVWAGKPLSALEGQALRDAILKAKNSSHIKWDTGYTNQDTKSKGMYLITISELLRLAIEEKEEREIEEAQQSEYEYDDEDEYEF